MVDTRIGRVTVPLIDEILGIPFKVLNDGFIRVDDYMGTDESIVRAARVSYGKGTRTAQEDRALIRYLMRHRHTTPFEMCEIKLHIRVPMDCWRQWIRHRTANVNEYSTRYSEAIDSAQTTHADEWRQQATGNRQGSDGKIDPATGLLLSEHETDLQLHARSVYAERIKLGVAREQARKDLPLSTYTEAYWKIDLHNLLHFLSLRMDSYAQEEIRSYANIIGNEIVARWCPIAWEAFLDYRLNSVSLSHRECVIIQTLVEGRTQDAIAFANEWGLLPRRDGRLLSSRERAELETTLGLLGLSIPWLGS